MKRTRWWIALVSGCMLMPLSAKAAERYNPGSDLRYPNSVQRTAYDDLEYYDGLQPEKAPATPSPSDLPPAPEAQAPAAAEAPMAAHGCSSCDTGCNSCNNGCGSCDTGCNSCGSGCGSSCCGPLCCEEMCMARLFDCCCLDECGMTITGWVNGGITWNPDDPDNRYNGPVTVNDRDGEPMLNQAWLAVERLADTGGCGCALGFRVDAVYGTDHRWMQARGLELNRDLTADWNDDHRFYGVALPQFYAEIGINDWSVKAGHFFTTVGYEVLQAPADFFYSENYMVRYAEPTTHTGILATRKLSDTASVHIGVHNGWNNFEDNNDALGIIGGVSLSDGDGTSVAVVTTVSDEQDDTVDDDITVWLITGVLSTQIGDRLQYVAAADVARAYDAFGDRDAEWYGIAQYLYYSLNCCWKAGVRYEYFSDDDGIRVVDFGFSEGGEHTASFNPIGIGGTGVEAHWQEIAIGLNYTPNANLRIRTEGRWDWVDEITGDSDFTPFSGNEEASQFLWGTDVIVQF